MIRPRLYHLDTKFLSQKLREFAGRLDKDFWGNIISVLDSMKIIATFEIEQLRKVEAHILMEQARKLHEKWAKEGRPKK